MVGGTCLSTLFLFLILSCLGVDVMEQFINQNGIFFPISLIINDFEGKERLEIIAWSYSISMPLLACLEKEIEAHHSLID